MFCCSYAASDLGELKSCDESQMAAYMTHAKTAFGAISTWDDAVIASVGNLIGGLSDTELATLTSSQIAAIETESISLIPSASFVGFTTVQLSGFSVAQAQSVTSTQTAGLSSAQKAALVSAGASIDSGATGGPQASMVFVLILAFVSLKFVM